MATFSTPEELADALAQACEGSASAAYDFCASTLTLLEMLKDEESKKPSIQPPLPPRPTEDPITTAELQEVEPPLPPVPQESAAAVGSDGWGLAITHRPLFMVYDFVKTPPPVRPRAPDGSPPMSATYDDSSTAGAPVQHEPPEPEEAEIEDQQDRRRSSVAMVKPCRIVVRDRYGEYRALIRADGTCINNRGGVIGYLNTEDGWLAGSREEEYLGCAKDQLSGDEVVVEDALDEQAAHMNLGSGCVYDAGGAIVAEIKRDGEVSSSMGSLLGTFTPFTMHSARSVLLYLTLVDPSMLSRKEAAAAASS